MKKILYILFAICLFTACSSDDDSEQTQNYTSFIVTIETSNKLKNCVAGYYTSDGLCKKLGDLGELTRGVYSPEIRVNIDTLTQVYVFTNTTKPLRFEKPYILTKNIKNILKVDINNSGISVTEWPE